MEYGPTIIKIIILVLVILKNHRIKIQIIMV